MDYINAANTALKLGSSAIRAWNRVTMPFYKRKITRKSFKAKKYAKLVAPIYKRRVASRKEIHYVEPNIITGAIATGGIYNLCNFVPEGTDFSSRVGRTIFAKYIQYDIVIEPPTNSGIYDNGQWAIVCDKQANGVVATPADFFDLTFNATGIGMAYKKIQTNVDRFQVLKQDVWTACNGVPDSPYRSRGFIKIPLSCSRVTYAGSAASTPLTNSFVILITSNNNTGVATTSASVLVTWRFAFTDL